MTNEPGHQPDQFLSANQRPPGDGKSIQRPGVEGPTRARAGQVLRGGLMRRVLVVSLALTITAFALIYLIFFLGQADEDATPPAEAGAEQEMEPPLPPGD